jgi:ectoine hydroxylase-related dioxygenase (phytanoyl-CoA dioxygenase family)
MTVRELVTNGYTVTGPLIEAEEIERVAAALARTVKAGAGSRGLLAKAWVRELGEKLRRHPAVASALPAGAVLVQCSYLKKYREQNWLVPPHQDLSIPVKARVEHPELGGWSEKEGALFVQPPVSVLDALVGLRLHIDECGLDDGPLRVVPGSHTKGRLSVDALVMARARGGEVACTVPRGGAMLLKPLLVHASSKIKGRNPRRVLHFVFGPAALPFGLEWQHTN